MMGAGSAAVLTESNDTVSVPALSASTGVSAGQEEAGQEETDQGSAEWIPDGVISAGEYAKSLTLSSGRYTVHWRNDADDLLMGLEGRTEGFVAIGFDPVQAMMGGRI